MSVNPMPFCCALDMCGNNQRVEKGTPRLLQGSSVTREGKE